MAEQFGVDGASIRIDLRGEGTIRQIDSRFVALTGWSMAETVGQPVGLLFGPHTGRDVVDRLRKAIERGEPMAVTPTQLYRMSGESFAATLELIIDRGTGLVRIRTDRVPAGDRDNTLAEVGSERLLEAVLEAVHDGILLVDSSGVVRRVNPGFLQLWHGGPEAPSGMPLEQILELPGRETDAIQDGMTAGHLITADGHRRPVTAMVVHSVDSVGRRFQVIVLRAAGGRRPEAVRLGAAIEAISAVAVRTVLKDRRAIGFGLLELEPGVGVEDHLGSQAEAVLDQAVEMALGVVSALLGPVEFVCRAGPKRLLLLFDEAARSEAIERLQHLAQEVGDRLAVAGAPLAEIDVYVAAEWVEPGSELAASLDRADAAGRLDAVIEHLVRQSREGRGATVLADLLDEADIEVLPVRTAAGLPSRYGLIQLDRRSRQRFDWVAGREDWTEATAVELDLLRFGRAMERLQRRGADGRAIDPPMMIVPMRYRTLIEAEGGERLAALSRGFGQGGRNRLAMLIHGLPDAVSGRGLAELIRRGFGLARFLVLEPGSLGDAAALGADEGLLALSIDFTQLGERIKQDPVPFRQLGDRLQKRGVATILRNIATPEVAALLAGLFPHVLLSGDGVEQWALRMV